MTKDELFVNLKTKLAIDQLNEMQEVVIDKINSTVSNVIIYSPTGSGKTIGYLFPLLKNMVLLKEGPQVVILAPSRELVLQITNVIKKLNSHVKVTCCYGGHKFDDERLSLDAHPQIIVATPGRLLDHINRNSISFKQRLTVVLDEFDKSLELGFADEMSQVVKEIPSNSRFLFTSATKIKELPHFIDLSDALILDFNGIHNLAISNRINVWQVLVKDENTRLNTLLELLFNISDERTMIFSNYRETAQIIHEYLIKNGIINGIYHGALEQIEREKSVSMFNNGSLLVLSSSDLGARGLDIANVRHIIHFQMPDNEDVYIHRNGRTARVNESGDVYIMRTKEELLPYFIDDCEIFDITDNRYSKCPKLSTLYISAGKKEKISKGDIVGFISKNTNAISSNEIGQINIFDHYSLVALPALLIDKIIKDLSSQKLKKRKVKLSIAKSQLRTVNK